MTNNNEHMGPEVRPTVELEFKPYKGTLRKNIIAADGEFWVITENCQRNAKWSDTFGNHYQLCNFYKLVAQTSGREAIVYVTAMHGQLGGRSINVIRSQLERLIERSKQQEDD